MKNPFTITLLALCLTACANTSWNHDEIKNTRVADAQYAYLDDGLQWWVRNWVQPHLFIRRTTYRAASWALSTDPQAKTLPTLRLTTQTGERPGPVLEFKCAEGVTSFSFKDTTIFSPFNSNFEMSIEARGERRWVTIAHRSTPRTLSIREYDLVERIFSELERTSNFTITVRDATPLRTRFIVDRSNAVFSEFRSSCELQQYSSNGTASEV